MKAKSIIKRVLSVLLVTVMLFSCWVFTAPTADAAGNNTYSGTAGNYDVRVSYTINESRTHSNNYSYNSWNESSNSNNMAGITVFYRNENGRSSTLLHSDYNMKSMPASPAVFSNIGFPTKLYVADDWNATLLWRACSFTVTKMEVKKHGANDNTYKEIWTGSIYMSSTTDRKYASVDVDANEVSNDSDNAKISNSSGAWTAKMPYPVVTSCTMPDYSTAFSKGDNPGGSSNFVNVTSSTKTNALSGNFSYSPSTIVDQYGVAIGGTLTPKYTITNRYRSSGSNTSWSSNSDDSSYNVTSSNGTVTASKAAGNQYHYCTVKAYLTWSLNSTDYDTGSTKNVGFNFPTYNVNYNYWTTEFFERTDTEMPTDNPEKEYVPFDYTTVTAATHTALYGDAPTQNPPTPDSNLKYYFSDTKHWYLKDSWTKPTSVTTNPKNVSLGDASGSEAVHSWSGTWVSFEGEAAYHGYGPEDFHRQSCSVYADHDRNGVHYKFQWHQWDTPVFTFESDGKSATVTRQCKTTGCRQTQTQTLTLDNGIVATVKTPATCTTDGVHTYTATSPWGDGATKSVDKTDISAPGHDWKTPTFKFADDGKTANATRVCNTDANHTETSAAVVTSRVKTKATCTTDGVTTYTATSPWNDGTTDSVDKTDIPAKGHNTTGQPWVSDATNHWKVCLNDSTHKLENAPHTWGPWTDKGNGKHTHTCNVCGYESEQTGHNYTDDEHAPTCTADGYIIHTCNDCGYSYTEYPNTDKTREDYEDFAALGHDVTGKEYQSDASNHWKICNNCGEQVYDNNGTWTLGTIGHRNASAVVENRVEPTCTATGSYDSVIYCSDCHRELSRTANVIPATGHDYGDWADDGTENHKRVCAHDANHVETEGHTFTAWSNTVPEGDAKLAAAMKEDYDASAECFRYCTVCYRIEYSGGHNYVGTETTPATCEGTGVKTYTCSICNNSYTETIPAKGHDFQIVKPEPTDGGTSCVIYYDCSRCDVCSAQKYEESTGEYVADETRTFTNAQAAETELGNDESLKVQAPSFNTSDATAFYEGAVPYINRPSQMRLTDKNANGTKTNQTVRFVGSVKIPSGVDYKVNLDDDADDVVIDFGFVWTQTKYITVNDQGETDYQTVTNVVVKRPVEGEENKYNLYDIPIGEKEDNDIVLYSYETYGTKDPSKLVIGGDMIQKMSVVSKNQTGDTVPEMNADASNWTGCTHWTANEGSDHYYSFNLVVAIKPGNWGKEYCARPYITYKYHGQTYTVYDAGTSNTDDDGRKYNHESVVSLATKIMAKNYLALGAANNKKDFSIKAVLNTAGLSFIKEYEQYTNYVLGSYKRDKQYVEDKVIFGQTKEDNEYLTKQKSTPTGSGSRQVYEWIDSSLVIDNYLIKRENFR